MNYYIYMAIAWTVLGVIQLYRAYTGTMKGVLLTLNRSQSALMSKGQRWGNAAFGICYLGFAIAYLALYFRHIHHA